jgi:PAS domain S-box-containing protein
MERSLAQLQLEVAALSGEVDAVMQGIVDRLMSIPGADGASLSTIDEEHAYFKVASGADTALLDRTLPLGETLGNECLHGGGVTVLRSGSGAERSLTPGAGTIVLAPIDYDGATRGILGLRSAAADAFDDSAVETIGLLAVGAAVALRNAEVVERLAAGERKYRLLHTHAADGILVSDTHGQLLDANDAAAALLWYSVDELRTMHARELFSAEHLSTQPPLTAELSARRELRGERPFRRKDGTEIDVEYSCGVLDDGRVHTTLRDISQRRRNEDRLRSSLGQLRAIVETQREISALQLDPDAAIAAILERTQRLTGADGVAVQWLEEGSSVYRHGSGVASAFVGMRLPLDASLSGHAAATGETIYAPDAQLDPRADHDACVRLGIRSLICAPLEREGVSAGVLTAIAVDADAFDELAVETTRLMAQFVGTVFRNSDELESRRRLVGELGVQSRALAESEARFRSAFQSASVGMNLAAFDGTFIQVNDRFAEMLGYTPEEVTALGVRGVTHPEEVASDIESAAQLRDGVIESFRREKRYIRKDGSILWADLSVAVMRGVDGRPSHAVGHVQDITQQREANLLFEATFERSVVPALIADDDRRLVDLNRAAVELLGVPREAAVGLTIDELTPDIPVAQLWAHFVAHGHLEAEATLRRPDGGTRRIEFVGTSNVRPGRHIAVVRDLTRQNELESQLRQAQKMEAVGRLAGGIAHDFNNLLTAISGYSEFLATGIEDPRLKRHAEEIRKAASRAAALTGQLLAFSRRQVLQPRVLDLNAVVSDMDSLLRRLIGEDVELITLLAPDLAAVRADPTQIEQVIVNLAVNARDAMPHGGSVTVQTTNVLTADGPFVEILLADTGIGMTEDERSQLFDPFFTTKQGGTGLGLATVYGIVDQSGGTIEVDSAPGNGSTFRVLLPGVSEEPEPTIAPTQAARAAGSETILLVEDEAVVRELVAEILETTGYTVLQAGDGPSALELLRRHADPVELLVTDVVMPGMSGPEVAQAVTAMRPGMQVLYTSGYTDSAIGHHGVLEPGIAFLQKPFSADDLTSKVRLLLDAPVASPS